MHKLVDGLKIGFGQVATEVTKERIVNIVVFILASFLGGLRGEEILKLVLGETRDFIDESETHWKYKHVVLPLRGRFKGESRKVFHFAAVWFKCWPLGKKRNNAQGKETVSTRIFLCGYQR